MEIWKDCRRAFATAQALPSCQLDVSVWVEKVTNLEECEPGSTHGLFNQAFTSVGSCYCKIADACRRCVGGGVVATVDERWIMEKRRNGARNQLETTGTGPACTCDATAPDV